MEKYGSNTGAGQRNNQRRSSGGSRREPLIIPPIPVNERCDYLNLDTDSEDDETVQVSPSIKSLSPESKNNRVNELKYDEERNKYFGGLKLHLRSTKNVPMQIVFVDQEGYAFLRRVGQQGERDLQAIKMSLLATYMDDGSLSGKRYPWEELVKGEIVVARVIAGKGDKNEFRLIRGRVLDIFPHLLKAKLVDEDSLKEYDVPKERIYRAYSTAMHFPFQVLKFGIEELRYFAGTEIPQKLMEISYWYHKQPLEGFCCSWDIGDGSTVPDIRISRFNDETWDFGFHSISNLGNLMGANYHMESDSKLALVCNVNTSGDIWVHYKDDTVMLGKLRILMVEAMSCYEKCLADPSTGVPEHIKSSDVFFAKISRNNLCRVAVFEDWNNTWFKRVKQSDDIVVECIDTGITRTVTVDSLVPMHKFSSLLRNIPAMCRRVRQVGLQSFAESVTLDRFTGMEFRVKKSAGWPDWACPFGVNMTLIRQGKRDFGLKKLVGDEATFYSDLEQDRLDEERRLFWETIEKWVVSK